MHISNIRLGFANNSSSSHSLIFLPNENLKDEGVENAEFGWGQFVCASKDAKNLYLAVMLQYQIQLPEKIKYLVIRELTGIDLLEYEDGYKSPYVDHQSIFAIPMSFEGEIPDEEFLKELQDYVSREGVVIAGGNDNGGESNLLSEGSIIDLGLPSEAYGLICRKDRKYGYWTLFHRSTGAKIRMILGGKVSPEKAEFPELVDLKITDFCHHNCPFCYQGSTPQGEHADHNDISAALSHLSDIKVFEVAIGGGEPTYHPKFVSILEEASRLGIVPNFSTRSLDWLRDPKKWVPIIDVIGSFAYSVQSSKDVQELATLMKYNGIRQSKVSIQYVMGSTSIWEFRTIVEEVSKSDFNLTLLGYKTPGDGRSFNKNETTNWIKIVKENYDRDSYYTPITIDTALAKEYEELLKMNQVPKITYHTQEGKFSMYVDAVEGKIGPSSYCDKNEMIDFSFRGTSSEIIAQAFAKW